MKRILFLLVIIGLTHSSCQKRSMLNQMLQESKTSCEIKEDRAEFVLNGVPITFIKVEAGSFTMGNTNPFYERETDEHPAHLVTLTKDFYIAETETTQELWMAFMDKNPSYKYNVGPQHPVDRVNLDNLQKFLNVLNRETGYEFRLPTEAEWEFACRGGNRSKGYKFSGGNRMREVGWYCDNTGETSHPVKQLKPNELGIYDMSGNVWEWCSDCFAPYPLEAQTDPVGPSEGRRIMRGGCWYTYSTFCRTTNRSKSTRQDYNLFTGFRLAISSPIK